MKTEMTYFEVIEWLVRITENNSDQTEWIGNIKPLVLENLFKLEVIEWASEREYFELSDYGAMILQAYVKSLPPAE